MEQVETENAESLFREISNTVKPIFNQDSTVGNDVIYEAIRQIQACQQAVERENTFSKNEELDDINTSTLKFLFLYYYSGKCYQSLQGMENRLVSLLSAKDSYNTFLEVCTTVGLVHGADLDGRNEQERMTADAKRQFKIDKYKRDKAAKARIHELQRKLYIARKDETDAGDHDTELRELYITQIQCYTRESMDELDLIAQEITMLRFHEQQQQQQQRQDGDAQDDRRIRRDNDGRRATEGNTEGGSVYPTGFVAPPPQPGPGISVTRTFKVGDQIMYSRETVKANIFGSHVAPPTMTLEEFGDQQKAEALERQAQRPEDGAAHASRRYKQLEADGDEDDADLVDQAAEKDRAWDDWKDNNPRGWGNKMGKRF